MANEYKYLDHAGLTRFKGKIQDILDTKVDKETGKYIVTVDESLSTASNNPVRNSAVTVALNGKLGTSGDSKDNTVSFTTGDVANDAAATAWTNNVGTISSGLSHATLLNRLSFAVKNLRYLKNLLGDTDISAIGGGSVTGALSALNTDKFSLYRSTLGSGSDLNNINTINNAGVYGISTGVDNCPLPYSSLIAIPSSGGMHHIVYNNSAVYVRSYTGNPLAWGNWVKVPTMSDLNVYKATSILDEVAAVYSGIVASDSNIMYIKMIGRMRMLLFRFKTSSAIMTGSVTLPSTIDGSQTETYGALASAGGNGGYAQYTNNTLLIRTSADSTNYISGQVVFLAKQ